MGILSILGALKTAKDFHDKYKTLCAIHHGETAFQALNQKFDKLSEHIYYAPHLQAVMDTSRTTQQCFQDRKQIHDRLEPIQRTLQSDIISSAVILTPEIMQQALAKNPWEVLNDIRPVGFFDLKKLPPEAVPVMFEHENMQYMGWQLRGTLPMLFNCDYNTVWMPDNPTRTAPSSTILEADFIVSPGGQYPTINSALSAAKAGDRIVVKTGLYREKIVINKAIELIGSGSPVIESNGECIEMRTDYAVVRGFTLKRVATDSKNCAVYIPQGSLVLEHCDISSESLSCVDICNQNSQGILRHCKIHDSKNGAGVIVYENGGGIIEDCDIFANAYSGIEIRTGGNPTVRRCKIHDGKQSGVFVYENGGGIIEDCDIFANAYSGIAITGGNPTVRRCKITANKYQAVYIHDNGRGQVENCDLRGNEKGAWYIDETSKVQESGNQI